MRVAKLAQEEGADMLNVTVRAVKRTGERDWTDEVTVGGVGMKLSEGVVSFGVRPFLIGNLKCIVRR